MTVNGCSALLECTLIEHSWCAMLVIGICCNATQLPLDTKFCTYVVVGSGDKFVPTST